MNPTPTLGQRLFSEMPDFFKKAHLIGLIMVIGAAVMIKLPIIPVEVTTIIGTFGTAVTTLSMFAVKDAAKLGEGVNAESLISLLPDLIDQVATIKDVVTKPQPVPTLSQEVSALKAAYLGPFDKTSPIVDLTQLDQKAPDQPTIPPIGIPGLVPKTV